MINLTIPANAKHNLIQCFFLMGGVKVQGKSLEKKRLCQIVIAYKQTEPTART